MGIKSDLYDLAGKVESKNGEIHEMIFALETIVSKLKSVESELLKVYPGIKNKADGIKE